MEEERGMKGRNEKADGEEGFLGLMQCMPVSVCATYCRSLVFIFLGAGIEGCTHLDKCRSSAFTVNHTMYCKVNVCMCVTETKRDALRVCG